MTAHAGEESAGSRGDRLFRRGSIFLLAFFLVFAFSFLFSSGGSAEVKSFSLVFASIVLEAIPFMLVGAFAGGLIEAFISREKMTSLLPKRGWVTVFIAAGLGMLFPICECAVVPVVRRLARKGLPASASIAYLLGGPVVNPVVAASTALAYTFDWRVVILRLLIGYMIAVFVALGIDWVFGKEPVFRADLYGDPKQHNHEHDHHHGHVGGCCACGCGHDHQAHGIHGFLQKIGLALRHASDDFVQVGHFLIIGAFIAAMAQTFIERKLFLGLVAYPGASLLLMMALAILLNLCSEADAFIAASFRGLLSFPAQMAFMLTGPVFDLKLLLMYQGVFRKRAILVLSVMILLAVFGASLGLELSGGSRP